MKKKKLQLNKSLKTIEYHELRYLIHFEIHVWFEHLAICNYSLFKISVIISYNYEFFLSFASKILHMNCKNV